MKIVATSDWHAYNWTEFSKTVPVCWNDSISRFEVVDEQDERFQQSKEMNSRLLNILNGLCDIRDYCTDNNISDVLMAGDTFHKRGTIEVVVFNAVYKILDSFYNHGVTVHILAGNHDQIDASRQPVSSIHGFREIAHVIEEPMYFKIADEEIVAVPYSKDKEFVLESIQTLRKECTNPDRAILMCHLGITGGKVGSGMYSMKDEYTLSELMSDSFKYVVVGHYHQPQLLDYNAIYAGTPVQNSFSDELKGENGYNGFFVLDTDKRYDIQFVPVISPRFITCNSVKELNKLEPEFIQNNYVRVKSSAKNAEEIQDTLEDLLGDDTSSVRLELEKDYVTEHRSDIGVSQSFDDAVRIYAREHFAEDDESLESVIELGLDILSQATVGGK